MAKEGKEAPFPVFGYQEERPSSWKSVENMWISGYFAHGYAAVSYTHLTLPTNSLV